MTTHASYRELNLLCTLHHRPVLGTPLPQQQLSHPGSYFQLQPALLWGYCPHPLLTVFLQGTNTNEKNVPVPWTCISWLGIATKSSSNCTCQSNPQCGSEGTGDRGWSLDHAPPGAQCQCPLLPLGIILPSPGWHLGLGILCQEWDLAAEKPEALSNTILHRFIKTSVKHLANVLWYYHF